MTGFVTADPASLASTFSEIIAVPVEEDGLVFLPESVVAEQVKDGDPCVVERLAIRERRLTGRLRHFCLAPTARMDDSPVHLVRSSPHMLPKKRITRLANRAAALAGIAGLCAMGVAISPVALSGKPIPCVTDPPTDTSSAPYFVVPTELGVTLHGEGQPGFSADTIPDTGSIGEGGGYLECTQAAAWSFAVPPSVVVRSDCKDGNCSIFGAPIDIRTGHMWHDEVDIHFAGGHIPLFFGRRYSSPTNENVFVRKRADHPLILDLIASRYNGIVPDLSSVNGFFPCWDSEPFGGDANNPTDDTHKAIASVAGLINRIGKHLSVESLEMNALDELIGGNIGCSVDSEGSFCLMAKRAFNFHRIEEITLGGVDENGNPVSQDYCKCFMSTTEGYTEYQSANLDGNWCAHNPPSYTPSMLIHDHIYGRQFKLAMWLLVPFANPYTNRPGVQNEIRFIRELGSLDRYLGSQPNSP